MVTIMGVDFDIATTTELVLMPDNPSWPYYDETLGQPYLDSEELKKVWKLKNLKKLQLGHFSVTWAEKYNLSGIENLQNLEELELYINIEEQGLTPLAKLTKLKKLDCYMDDLTLLTNLTNLNELNLKTYGISDITPLSKLTNLTYLELQGDHINDITPLAKLTNLTELILRLWESPIAEADINWLKTQLPNCEILIF